MRLDSRRYGGQPHPGRLRASPRESRREPPVPGGQHGRRRDESRSLALPGWWRTPAVTHFSIEGIDSCFDGVSLALWSPAYWHDLVAARGWDGLPAAWCLSRWSACGDDADLAGVPGYRRGSVGAQVKSDGVAAARCTGRRPCPASSYQGAISPRMRSAMRLVGWRPSMVVAPTARICASKIGRPSRICLRSGEGRAALEGASSRSTCVW